LISFWTSFRYLWNSATSKHASKNIVVITVFFHAGLCDGGAMLENQAIPRYGTAMKKFDCHSTAFSYCTFGKVGGTSHFFLDPVCQAQGTIHEVNMSRDTKVP
jgi:hypothetical protein